MKTVLSTLALVLAMSASAEANSTKCTTADGTLTYLLENFIGGTRPRPGTALSRQTWTYSGKVVFKQMNYAPCELEHCPPTESNQIDEDLVTEFFGDANILSKSDIGHKIEETYVQKARIYRVSGKPILEGQEQKHLEDYLLCHSVLILYP